MKEGWEYRKLGDITTTINGLWTGKKPPFVTVAVVRNTNFTKDCKLDMSNVAYLDVEEKQYVTRKLKSGDIIIEKSGGSDKQPVGRPVLFEISDGEYSFSNFTSTLRINDLEQLSPKFLHYSLYGAYLRGDTLKMQSKTTGIHNLDFKAYKNLLVPTPSIAEQKLTIEELDLLSSIIEKKKAQLKELDHLAQSLFYEMFGDPITNEKGWEVKKIGEIASFYSGKAHENAIDEDGKYIVVNAKYISSNGDIIKKTNKQLFPLYTNDIVMVMSDVPNGKALARCSLITSDNLYSLNQRICAFRDYKQNPIYLLFVLNRNSYYLGFDDGNGQTNLRKNEVINCPVSLPPLVLQQQFASKIEAIEHQKELIKQSIKEVETLFNSRMDYYFN